MITGLHGIFYTTDPDGARAFLRDKIGVPFHDAGGGWLIFEIAEGHVGCHPSDRAFNGVSFACDDLDATMKEAAGRGAASRSHRWSSRTGASQQRSSCRGAGPCSSTNRRMSGAR